MPNAPTPPMARLDPPSVVQMARESIRHRILLGEEGAVGRLIEERLCEQLGISRPPLREALRLLEQEGLVTARPRRGWKVVTMTDQDVHELLTLRSALERLAIELGVPVRAPERLLPCWEALQRMERGAEAADRGAIVEAAYAFHSSIVRIAGHRRAYDIYVSLQHQIMLCMARNLHVREHFYEDLHTHVQRHRRLLELIEEGDPDAVLSELAVHGERSFIQPPPEGEQ